MLAIVCAVMLQGQGPVLGAEALMKLAKTWRANPQAPVQPVRYELEFPLIPDTKTSLAALQSPAGYAYDRRTGILSIDVDLGAVTPSNYADFDKQTLERAPPLRTLFFDTRSGSDTVFHVITGERGDPSAAQGWRVTAQSVGLAIAADAKAYGRGGGDLPDDFPLPFVMKMRVNPDQIGAVVRSLRIRFAGVTRTIGGRSVLCSRSTGDGYVVDEFTQKTPNVIIDDQCFTPAVLSQVSLVRTTGGPPLKTWTRAAAEPSAEGPDTAVIMAGTRNRDAPSLLAPVTASSPSATAPLPKR
ncbi:hypothetical protein BH09PSE2_BH09PSE2_00130 [soil metagenome]